MTLIELIVFIVIVSVGLAGVMLTYSTVVRGSADPMVRKQALAIAESLLLEIEQQPFTWCDPQDEKVAIATGFGACTTNQSSLAGPSPAGEARGSLTNPFDNVSDYGNLAAPATDLNGNTLPGYAVRVTITDAGGAAPFADMPAGAMLRIAVTVTGPGENVTLVGYRARYAPNAAG